MGIQSFQSTSLKPVSKIHSSHDMAFRPCLFLECSKCMLSVKANAEELKKPCCD